MKRNICVVITARPSYSRVKSALNAIKNHPDLNLQLIVSGSALLTRYGSAVDFMRSDGFEPESEIYHIKKMFFKYLLMKKNNRLSSNQQLRNIIKDFKYLI